MSYHTQKRTGFPPPSVNVNFLLKDLEGEIKTLSTHVTLQHPSTSLLRNFTSVASYSWFESTLPSIAVPGCPRIWKNAPPSSVPADSGLYYVDGNGAHMGRRSPLLPIFAAVDVLHENFPYRDLDLVTDRNSLRKLLRCIDQQHNRAFRIDVDLAKNTCLFTRCEEALTETVDDFRGYGHEYEKAATRSQRGAEKEVSHHRIVTYDFGGLHVLLRYEVDACTESESEDNLLASFSALSIGSQTRPPQPQLGAACINRFGIQVTLTSPRCVVPQSRVIEIKTRSSRKGLNWMETYPQLYLSQTPYVYLAKHTSGRFGSVEKIDINGQAMTPYTKQAKDAIGKLQLLLVSILEAARKQGEGRSLSLVYYGGKLKLYKRKEGTGKLIEAEIFGKFRH